MYKLPSTEIVLENVNSFLIQYWVFRSSSFLHGFLSGTILSISVISAVFNPATSHCLPESYHDALTCLISISGKRFKALKVSKYQNIKLLTFFYLYDMIVVQDISV